MKADSRSLVMVALIHSTDSVKISYIMPREIASGQINISGRSSEEIIGDFLEEFQIKYQVKLLLLFLKKFLFLL